MLFQRLSPSRKRSPTLPGILALCLGLAATGSSLTLADQPRGWTEDALDLAGINRIRFGSRGTLYVVQGEANRLTIEGDPDALEEVTVRQRNGVLIIDRASDDVRWWVDGKAIKAVIFRVELENLNELRQTGHSEVKVGPFTVDELSVLVDEHAALQFSSINARRLDIEVGEHGNVSMETLDSDKLVIDIREHGDLYAQQASLLNADVRVRDHGEAWLAGEADQLRLRSSEHGSADLSRLHASLVEARAVDHSSLEVWADEQLRADTRDNAHIDQHGAAKRSKNKTR